jgi:hypothetical protein
MKTRATRVADLAAGGLFARQSDTLADQRSDTILDAIFGWTAPPSSWARPDRAEAVRADAEI